MATAGVFVFIPAVTSWGGPGRGSELLPMGVVAFKSVCLEPCGNMREAQG